MSDSRRNNVITTIIRGNFTAVSDAGIFRYPIPEDATVMAELRATYHDSANSPPLGSAAFIHLYTVRRLAAGTAALVTSGSLFPYSVIDAAIAGAPNPGVLWFLNTSTNSLEIHVTTSSASTRGFCLIEIKLHIN